MKAFKNILVLFCIVILESQISFGQDSFYSSLRFDANLNYTNKKRSYAVYSGDKYASSGYFVGLDFALIYETKKYEYGIEYFSPFRHINASIGYNGLNFSKTKPYFKLIPDIKLGYSPLLEKVYYGLGGTFRIKWFSFGYSKILHFKSGNSKHYGDGLDSFNVGISLRFFQEKEIPFRTTNGRGFLN